MKNTDAHDSLLNKIPDAEFKNLEKEMNQYNNRPGSDMDPSEIMLTGSILLQLARLKKARTLRRKHK